jgi:cytochrome b561|tara:strand:- start:444 stop:992 length:549 start_codon:yes stop_codon:yes gene_type:complete
MVDYLKAQKVIHWLMAIIIMLDLNVAQKFGGDMELWDRLESRVDHAQAGLIVTFLFLLRIFLRYKYGAPALPSEMPGWQVISAKAGHYGLYILMGMLIVTGILSANFTSDPVLVFGLLNLSSETQNIEMFNLIRGIHEFSTNAIILLIVIHILAALYHHFIVKDQTTINMTKFWTSKVKNEL